MKQKLNEWAELLTLVIENKDGAQGYALHVAKVHKPLPVTEGDGSAEVKCPRCEVQWPCYVIDELLAWVEIL
jgi:phage FluMu protein Com